MFVPYSPHKERDKEIETLCESVKDIHEIYSDLASLVDQQSQPIDHIETKADEIEIVVEQGVVELKEAERLQLANPLRRITMIGACAMAGAVVGGPIGLVIGLKAGVVGTAIGGGLLGGYVANKVTK